MFDFITKINGRPLPCTAQQLHRVMGYPSVVSTCKEIAQLVKHQIEPLERQMAETDDGTVWLCGLLLECADLQPK